MADIILRVVFEGSTYDLDIQNDVPLRLDVSAVENDRIGNFFGVGSQTFDLPGTKKNNRFFKHAYQVGTVDIPAFYNTIQAYVIYNGETLLEGQLLLLEAITDQKGYVVYKCQLSDTVVQFKDAIANKLISQADWSAYDHTLTSSSIVDSWSDNLLGGSVFYPLCDFGADSKADWPAIPRVATGASDGYITSTATPMQAKQFLPAVRVKDTLDVIFDQVGFSYTGSFVSGSDFENLYILPKATENLGAGDAQFNGLDASDSSVIPGMTTGDVYSLNFVAPIDPGNNFNTLDDTYTVPIDGDYTMSGTFNFITNPVTPANSPVTFYVEFTQNGSPIGTTAQQTLSTGQFQQPMVIPSQKFSFSAGDEIQMIIRAFFSGSPVNGFPYTATWNIPNSAAPTTYEGVSVNMANQWDAQTKSLDILKGLIEQFNLVFTPVYRQNNLISIDTFDTWMSQGTSKDWTDKFETAIRVGIKHTVSEQQRELKFANVDDNDRFSQVAIEDTPNYQYGTLRLLSDNNISQGTRNVGTLFAPTVLGSQIQSGSVDAEGNPTFNLDLASSFVFPHLYKFNNAEQKAYKFKPRIGYKVTNGLPAPIYIGLPLDSVEVIGSYSTLANISQIPLVPGSTNDLLFNGTYTPFAGGITVTGGKTAYEKYWKTYIESLYWDESRKVTLDIQFNKEEYKDIRLNDIIFIKDQQYRINKISGFNVSKNDVSTVELIRLYPAYYPGSVIPVPPTTTTSTTTTTTAPTTTTSTSTTTSTTTAATTTTSTSTTTSTTTEPTTTTSTSTTTSTTTLPTTTTSTSTTTTTTTCALCYTYYVENYSLTENMTIQYQDCSGSLVQDVNVPADSTTPDFCACSGSVQRQGGSLAYDIVFVWPGCGPEPTTTTTTSTTTTIDPLGCYEYEIECLNAGGCLVEYTDCSGNPQDYTIPFEAVGLQCARPTPTCTGGVVTFVGPCTTTTTSTSTTTTSTTLPTTTTTSTTTSTTTIDPYTYYFAQPCGGGSTVYFRSTTAYTPGESVQIDAYGTTCYEVGTSGAPINANNVINAYPDCAACLPPTTTTSTSTTTSTTTLACECITVDVLNSQLNVGGLDLYYIVNDCAGGSRDINLATALGQEQGGSTYFGICSRQTLSNLFKYGPSGSPFVGEPGMNVNPNGPVCTVDIDCSPVLPTTTTSTSTTTTSTTAAPTTTTSTTTSTTAAPTTTSTSTTTSTTTCPPEGTLLSTVCFGFDLYGYYADGFCGENLQLIEVNSPSCGYEPPTTTTTSTTTSTTAAPTTTSTSTSTTTSTTTLANQSYIIENCDGSAYEYIALNSGFTTNDVITLDGTNTCCWTVGGESTNAPTVLPVGLCPEPTTTTTSTTTSTTTTAVCKQFFMSTSGYSTAAGTCGASTTQRRRHNGAGFEPTVGDTVFSNVDCSTFFNGGSLWYLTDLGSSIQIGPTGLVVDEEQIC